MKPPYPQLSSGSLVTFFPFRRVNAFKNPVTSWHTDSLVILSGPECMQHSNPDKNRLTGRVLIIFMYLPPVRILFVVAYLQLTYGLIQRFPTHGSGKVIPLKSGDTGPAHGNKFFI